MRTFARVVELTVALLALASFKAWAEDWIYLEAPIKLGTKAARTTFDESTPLKEWAWEGPNRLRGLMQSENDRRGASAGGALQNARQDLWSQRSVGQGGQRLLEQASPVPSRQRPTAALRVGRVGEPRGRSAYLDLRKCLVLVGRDPPACDKRERGMGQEGCRMRAARHVVFSCLVALGLLSCAKERPVNLQLLGRWQTGDGSLMLEFRP